MLIFFSQNYKAVAAELTLSLFLIESVVPQRPGRI